MTNNNNNNQTQETNIYTKFMPNRDNPNVQKFERGVISGVIASFAIGAALYPIEVRKILSQTATSFKERPGLTFWAFGLGRAIQAGLIKNAVIGQRSTIESNIKQIHVQYQIQTQHEQSQQQVQCNGVITGITAAVIAAIDTGLSQYNSNKQSRATTEQATGQFFKPKGFSQRLCFATNGLPARFTRNLLTASGMCFTPEITSQIMKITPSELQNSEQLINFAGYFISACIAASLGTPIENIYRQQLKAMDHNFKVPSIWQTAKSISPKQFFRGTSKNVLATSIAYMILGAVDKKNSQWFEPKNLESSPTTCPKL